MSKNIVKRTNKDGLTEKQTAMLQALKKTCGVVSHACDIVGITNQLHYHWLKKNPEYKKAYNDQAEYALDFAETQLFKQMKNGSSQSTIFYLRHKGKSRGYGDDMGEYTGRVTINITGSINETEE